MDRGSRPRGGLERPAGDRCPSATGMGAGPVSVRSRIRNNPPLRSGRAQKPWQLRMHEVSPARISKRRRKVVKKILSQNRESTRRPFAVSGVVFSCIRVFALVPAPLNPTLRQSHFIKTVEELFDALAGAVPQLQFGSRSASPRARASASLGQRFRAGRAYDGNALAIGAGHLFIVFLRAALRGTGSHRGHEPCRGP